MKAIKKLGALTNKVMILLSSYLLSASVSAQDTPAVVGNKVGANMDAMTMIVSLLLVLGLIVILALLVKRFQPMIQMNSGLKVVSSLSLGAKERIVVVQVGENQLLLGVTSEQICLLEKLESPLKAERSSSVENDNSLLSLFKKS